MQEFLGKMQNELSMHIHVAAAFLDKFGGGEASKQGDQGLKFLQIICRKYLKAN